MTALQSKTSDAYSKEDPVTKRHLKFLMYLIELAKKDPEWNGQLREMAESFGEIQQ